MSSTRAIRLLVPRQWTPSITRPCVLSRCYATKPPKSNPKAPTAKPNPRATAAELNSVRRKAAARKAEQLENDSLAARTPLRKPSAGGLGVPSASPSSGVSKSSNPRAGANDLHTVEGPVSAEERVLEQAEAQEHRMQKMREHGRESRSDKKQKEEKQREWDEKYKRLRGTYMRVVVGLPFVIVLSWELWQRLVNGKEQKVWKRPEEGESLLEIRKV